MSKSFVLWDYQIGWYANENEVATRQLNRILRYLDDVVEWYGSQTRIDRLRNKVTDWISNKNI